MACGDKINRRALLAGVSAAVASAASGRLSAESTESASEKGAPVWHELDQKALDDAYDLAVYAPNMRQILRRYARNSELVRARIGAPMRIAYGPTLNEELDFYATAAKSAPVNIFIHGIDWRTGAARDYGFPAEMFVNAGAHFAVLDFNSVDESGGNLMTLVEQARRAVIWTYKNAERFGGDPEKIYVCGHSSGGHLAAVLLTTDWIGDFDVPPNIIKGGVCASGVYDLKPVRLSKYGRSIDFSDAMEDALSPQRHIDRLLAPVAVIFGTEESPEFQRQARVFAAAAKAAGKPAKLMALEGYNHFEVLEQLANPLSAFARTVLHQMKLGPG